ncbi:MAG: AAA family ATPase [Acidimicrobiales bacterium]
MTVVALASLKGAPGVTTMACLVGAGWPAGRRVVLCELDPCGGDLAPRFGLSARCGWSSFSLSVRRTSPKAITPLEPHLQQLASGLQVLAGPVSGGAGDWFSPFGSLLEAAGGSCDLVVDLGRMPTEHRGIGGVLERVDALLVVVRGDATSALRAREQSGQLRARADDRVGLIVIETGPYPPSEIASFSGLRLAAAVPFDPGVASVAGGSDRSERRLARSSLFASSALLAARLTAEPSEPTIVKDPSGSRWRIRRRTGRLPSEELHLPAALGARRDPAAPCPPAGTLAASEVEG